MPDTTEARDIIDTAQEAVGAQQLEHGIYYDGVTHEVVDIRDQLHDEAQRLPDLKAGSYGVVDVDSFAGYLAKHGLEQTELWGHRDGGRIVATIDAHAGNIPGRERHTASLQLRHSDDWKEWGAIDGKWLTKRDFSEFIEDHLPNFGKPTGAEMLELARSFKATVNVEFGETQHAGGKTTVAYRSTSEAKAGQKGNVQFPDTVTLGIYVYDQGKAYALGARIRYRVTDGSLALGFKLDRPKDVLQQAFGDVVDEVEDKTGRTVWATS